MGSYLTAYTSSPWGAGQFRPAVVVPAVFAALFGPVVGGVGAAVGTLIVDSIKHGFPYPPGLVASVPGNLVGFLFFGWLMKKEFSWGNFIRSSQITLLVSNAMTAFLYVYYRTFIEGFFPPAFKESWIYISLGFLAWWYVTMLPFMLLLGPPFIRAIASAFPGLVSKEISLSTIKSEASRSSFSLAMILPGIVMLAVGIMMTLADPSRIIELKLAQSPLILAGMQVMFVGSGLALLVLGSVTYLTGKTSVSIAQVR